MEILNIHSKSEDERARRLSNFSEDPFWLDSIKLSSVEGFIQGIKFRLDDPLRMQAFSCSGIVAKRMGRLADHSGFVWWPTSQIVFASSEHHKAVERAIRAKFAQNLEAKRMLLATEGLVLTHETGEPDSQSLPKALFCRILTNIREETIKNRAVT